MERLRSLKRKVSVRAARRRSHSPNSSTSSLASSSRNSSKAELSSSVTSSPARAGGVSSLSSSWVAPEKPAETDSAASGSVTDSAADALVAPHGAEGQAGIHPGPSDTAAVATRDADRADAPTITAADGGAPASTTTPNAPAENAADSLESTSKDVAAQQLPSKSPDAAVATAVASDSDAPGAATLRQRRAEKPVGGEKAPIAKSDQRSAAGLADKMALRRSWTVLAAVSGAFAALNGTFAKLTTADRTDSIAAFVALHTGFDAQVLNPLFRGGFFLLNLVSNAIMWALFTRALTAHTSTTQVSLINTSANFLITAVLGYAIFSEALPPAWFGGAALLVVGTVIIGQDRKAEAPAASGPEEEAPGRTSEEKARDAAAAAAAAAASQASEESPLLAGEVGI